MLATAAAAAATTTTALPWQQLPATAVDILNPDAGDAPTL